MIMKNYHMIKELNSIAIPLIIQSITGLCLGLIDQAMIGRISVISFGAIGIGISILSFLAGILGYISTSFNIKASRVLGKNNTTAIKEYFLSSIVLNTIVGLLLGIFLVLGKRTLLMYIFGFEGEILEQACIYINIMSPYLILQLLLFNFSALLKIQKQTKWILISSTISTISNLILNYILIFGKLGMPILGIRGAAISTVISMFLNLSIYVYLSRSYIDFKINSLKTHLRNFKELIVTALPLMTQELLEGSIFIVGIQALISNIGVIELSSYLIVVQINNILLMPMYMYGTAILTLVSENLGKEDFAYIKNIPKVAGNLAFILYFIGGIICILYREYIPNLITNDVEVIAYASNLIPLILVSNLFNSKSTIYQYSMQAIDSGKDALFIATKINFISLFIMLIIFIVSNGSIMSIFIGLFINFTLLWIFYSRKYENILDVIRNCN
ncbi:hypothetical protein AN640_06405 [Candidatus Epulonipiscium fishelsonii]|uniref:Uncharacterized protein n=1 Tax=Candidatus Epulonipiscium fishelsonii TaxID=77094 RepID=A0ACC8XH94_9FIRM|nr:hypothetical protein AN640_06405 [Epulopiscium sp. SCG-D08WGA-EpuloA1]